MLISLVIITAVLGGCQSRSIYGTGPITLSENTESGFQRWLTHDTPTAFAVTKDGRFYWGLRCEAGNQCLDDWDRLISLCETRAKRKCYIFAEYGKITWKGYQKPESYKKSHADFSITSFTDNLIYTGKIHRPGDGDNFYIDIGRGNQCTFNYKAMSGLSIKLNCEYDSRGGGIKAGKYDGKIEQFSWVNGGNIDLRSSDSALIEMKIMPYKGEVFNSNKESNSATNTYSSKEVSGGSLDSYETLRVGEILSDHKNKISKIYENKNSINVLIIRDIEHTHFSSKGAEWVIKFSNRYFCRYHYGVLEKKNIIANWKNPYGDHLATVVTRKESCSKEGVKRLSESQIQIESNKSSKTMSIPVQISWAGATDPIQGKLKYSNKPGGGSIKLEVTKAGVNCSGNWKFSNGSYDDGGKVRGVWAVSCSDGKTVTGEYESSEKGSGSGEGFDNNDKKVTIRYGELAR